VVAVLVWLIGIRAFLLVHVPIILLAAENSPRPGREPTITPEAKAWLVKIP
jgi:hypothetical protein